MKKSIACLFAVVTVIVPWAAQSAQAQSLDFEDTDWIWCLGETSPASLPACVNYFRAEVMIPESPALKSAEVIITADNLFVLYLNGQPVGESLTSGNAWKRRQRWDAPSLHVPVRSVVAFEAFYTRPGPAEWIMKLVIDMA
ncbi:MAG: hypothetical protein GY809_06290, partial [Planctomycetes bacterium]|nr:hypothetical protein [Planctomycetota bacterium]